MDIKKESLLSLLLKVEWHTEHQQFDYVDTPVDVCPCCKGLRPVHSDSCELSAMITELKKEQEPEPAPEVSRLRGVLEKINIFGSENSGRGYTCAKMAREALR